MRSNARRAMRFTVLGTCALVTAVLATDLHACTCIGSSLKRRFITSTDVFVVEFLSVTRGQYRESATIRVEQQFLGARVEESTLMIAGGLCSLASAKVGNKALIFATRTEDGRLEERGCTAVPMNEAGAGEAELRTLRRRAWWWRIERRIRSAGRLAR